MEKVQELATTVRAVCLICEDIRPLWDGAMSSIAGGGPGASSRLPTASCAQRQLREEWTHWTHYGSPAPDQQIPGGSVPVRPTETIKIKLSRIIVAHLNERKLPWQRFAMVLRLGQEFKKKPYDLNQMTEMTEIVNFRYTFLPIPIVLGVPIPKDEWRTTVIASRALHHLELSYGADMRKTLLKEVPSALLVKLLHSRPEFPARVERRQQPPLHNAKHLTDVYLRENISLVTYVAKNDDCIIEIFSRPTKPLVDARMLGLLGSVGVVFCALSLYLGKSILDLVCQLVVSLAFGWYASIVFCTCKVVAK